MIWRETDISLKAVGIFLKLPNKEKSFIRKMTFSPEMHKTDSTETESGNKSLFKIKPPNLFNIILTFIQAGGVHPADPHRHRVISSISYS